jgi:photosystem II stability/assembly factor-like uncharacterized protein
MKKLILLIAMVCVIAISCKKENSENEPQPDPNQEVIVAENTKIIDQQTRAIISNIDTSDYSITFDGSTDVISDLQVGDILVDSTSEQAPYGYLRKVTSISNNKDGQVIVTTGLATLTEAVNKGSIDFNTGKLTMAHLDRFVLADGVEILNQKNTDFTVFSLDYEQEFDNENGKVTISGHTELDIEFFFEFDWDFEWLALPPHPIVEKFESGVEIRQSASIMCVSEAGAGIKKRIPLGKFYFTPWTFMVGPVPVVFVPRIELFVEIDGSITAVFTASASENFEGRVGTSYTDEDGWNAIAEKTFNTDYVAPNLTAGANFEAHVGPEIALLLYGVAGPTANVTGFAKVEAAMVTGTQNWNLDFIVGSRSQVGVVIDILGFSEHWNKDVYLFEEVLLHLDNEPFGNYFYISTPVDGQYSLVGDIIDITTSYTGEKPDEVKFIINYNEEFTDTEEPFQFSWNTTNELEGRNIIRVTAYKNGIETGTDYSYVNLVKPVWDIQHLSDVGLGSETNANDLFFINTTHGWMTVDGPNQGMLLSTTDAGISWQQTYSSSTPLKKVIMYNNLGEGIFLDGFGKVLHTPDGGVTMSELTYGQFSQPSFQWKEIFDFVTNNDGEIVAVGKDEGIPYKYRIYRAEMAFHEPTGYFEVPYPNEYGSAPNIVMNGNNGFLYNVYSEDEPARSYYMTSTDGGVSWDGFDFGVVTSDAKLNNAHMPDESHVWIVGGDNYGAIVLMSDDGGGNWIKVGLTGIPEFSSIYMTSDSDGYATVKDWTDEFEAKLYKTNDGGHTWSPMIDTRAKYGMSKVFFLGQDFGVVCGKGPQIFRYSVN